VSPRTEQRQKFIRNFHGRPAVVASSSKPEDAVTPQWTGTNGYRFTATTT
jgi:hypothetical protein